LHRSPPQKIHIQSCDGIRRWNGLTSVRMCGLVDASGTGKARKSDEEIRNA
jgi:hypothetical protein